MGFICFRGSISRLKHGIQHDQDASRDDTEQKRILRRAELFCGTPGITASQRQGSGWRLGSYGLDIDRSYTEEKKEQETY